MRREKKLKKKTKQERRLTVRLRKEEDEEEYNPLRFLDDIETLLIGEALKLDRRRLRYRKKHGDYVV